MNLSKIELLAEFGFNYDPFDDDGLETADRIRLKRILAISIQSRGMVSVVGDRGIGKTKAVKAALVNLDALVVKIRPADKERLLISDIEQEIIFKLSDDQPRRGKVIRTRQLRRILGEASRKKKVVVVIEEGHRLHGQTLRSLKSLRELDWMGEENLFSVILVGQSDPMNKPGVSEVRLRTDCIQMHGLVGDEIKQYIERTVGSAFEDETIEFLAKSLKRANFLDLQQVLVDCMFRAMAAGRDMVTLEDLGDDSALTVSKTDQAKQKRSRPTDGKAEQRGSAIKNVLNRRLGNPPDKQMAAAG